jgi:hypothetical protein
MASGRPTSLYVGIALLALAILIKIVAEAAVWYELRQNPGTVNFREMTIEFWVPYPMLILGTLGVLAIAYFLIRWLIQRNSI